jgi:hypothetical protein
MPWVPSDDAGVGDTGGVKPASATASAACGALLTAAVAAMFARRQSIWIDETTQLNGISLGPAEVLRWLLGDPSNVNGVPADRSPPVSYFLGQLWSVVFGPGEQSLRMLGIVAVGSAVAILVYVLLRRFGWLAGLAGIACFALMPQIAATAAEVRPYPFMLLFSSVGWIFFAGLVAQPSDEAKVTWREPGRWVGLGAACLLAAYTHFFGLLMATGFFFALLVEACLRHRSKKPVFVTAGAVAVLAIGLLPFVRQAMAMSHGPGDSENHFAVGRVARLLVRLFVSPSVSVSSMAMLAVLGGYLLLLVAGFRRHGNRPVARGIVLVLGLPLVLSTAAAAMTSGFDALAPHYNVWMLPGVALGVAIGARGLVRTWPRLALSLIVALAALNVWGDYRLVQGDAFTHGPHNAVRRLLAVGSGEPLAVVIDKGAPWGYLYFPLRFDLGTRPSYFLLGHEGASMRLRHVESEESLTVESLEGYGRVLLMRAQQTDTKQIGQELSGKPLDIPVSGLWARLSRESGWRQVGTFRHVSFVSATGTLFERVRRAP